MLSEHSFDLLEKLK